MRPVCAKMRVWGIGSQRALQARMRIWDMSENAEKDDLNEAAPAAPEPVPQPQRLALPPPLAAEDPDRPGLFDHLISFIELRPVLATAVAFVLLLGAHITVMNAAGAMAGLSVGGSLFFLQAAGFADLLLLAIIAYNFVLPTFLARSCLTAFADTAGALTCNDKIYDDHLSELASGHWLVRSAFSFFWAAILTPVFGNVLQSYLPEAATATPLLTIWMYLRLALLFGLLGSSLSYIALLHYRLSGALGQYLRVDLFDMTPLLPLARHIRSSVIFLSVPVALVGPILAKPEAMTASATVLGILALLVLLASFGSMLGARKAIRAAKHLALTELHAYSREIWRRAYVNGRVVEAVALPALAGMITIRNQIERMSNWPGGWTNLAHCIVISVLPALAWFGSVWLAWLLSVFFP
jgi:hypothetical protein